MISMKFTTIRTGNPMRMIRILMLNCNIDNRKLLNKLLEFYTIPGPEACSEIFLESKLPLSILYLPGPSFLF